jgi:hypothetical protein
MRVDAPQRNNESRRNARRITRDGTKEFRVRGRLFTALLNTSVSTVQKWQIGQNVRPALRQPAAAHFLREMRFASLFVSNRAYFCADRDRRYDGIGKCFVIKRQGVSDAW